MTKQNNNIQQPAAHNGQATPASFGQCIAALREHFGLSTEEFADITGTSASQVLLWESGKEQPELSNLSAICQSFGVTFDRFCQADYPDKAAPDYQKKMSQARKVSAWPTMLFMALCLSSLVAIVVAIASNLSGSAPDMVVVGSIALSPVLALFFLQPWILESKDYLVDVQFERLHPAL